MALLADFVAFGIPDWPQYKTWQRVKASEEAELVEFENIAVMLPMLQSKQLELEILKKLHKMLKHVFIYFVRSKIFCSTGNLETRYVLKRKMKSSFFWTTT